MIPDGPDVGEPEISEVPLGRLGRTLALPLVPIVAAWDAARALVSGAKAAVSAIVRYLVVAWDRCWTAVVRKLRAVFEPIVAAIATMHRWITERLRSWAAWIVARLRAWAAWVARIFDWCFDIVRRLVAVAARGARIIVRPLVSVARWIRATAWWTWLRVVAGLRQAARVVRVVWTFAARIVIAAVRPLAMLAHRVIHMVESIARWVVVVLGKVVWGLRGIVRFISSIWRQIIEPISAVIRVAFALLRRAAGAVVALVRRMWEPIRAAWIALVRAARAVVQAVLVPLRRALGFARTCVRRLGSFLGRGGGAVWRRLGRGWRRIVAWLRRRAYPVARVVRGAKEMLASVRIAARRLARDARTQARSVLNRASRRGRGPDAQR